MNEKEFNPILMIAEHSDRRIGVMVDMQSCPRKRNGDYILVDILKKIITEDTEFASCVYRAVELVEEETMDEFRKRYPTMMDNKIKN